MEFSGFSLFLFIQTDPAFFPFVWLAHVRFRRFPLLGLLVSSLTESVK